MRAIVLTYDKCRPITEHMLRTYLVHWPNNPFLFRVPYQANAAIEAHGQRVEMIHCGRSVMETITALLDGLPENDWIYWCIDDKFLIKIDPHSVSYFADWLLDSPQSVAGFSFCRARHLRRPPTVSAAPVARTERGDLLLRRFNYNNIWLHQFLRVRAPKSLFALFPRDVTIPQLDIITRQGPDAVSIPDDELMYVTEKNYVVYGESTVAGKVTRGCLSSMERLGLPEPGNFQTEEVDIVIGTL